MLTLVKESFLKFVRYIKWLYMLYELNTYISICEPWEKWFINVLIGSSIAFMLFSTYYYIPGYVSTVMKYLFATSQHEMIDDDSKTIQNEFNILR